MFVARQKKTFESCLDFVETLKTERKPCSRSVATGDPVRAELPVGKDASEPFKTVSLIIRCPSLKPGSVI